jgi:hypothetical protein
MLERFDASMFLVLSDVLAIVVSWAYCIFDAIAPRSRVSRLLGAGLFVTFTPQGSTNGVPDLKITFPIRMS